MMSITRGGWKVRAVICSAYRSAAPAGTVEIRRSGGSWRASKGVRVIFMPRRSAVARRSLARVGVRGGGAGARDDHAGGGRGGGGGHAALGEGGEQAGHVGVVAVPPPGGEHDGVRRADLGGQGLDVIEQWLHGALERHGQRQARPV